MAVPTTPKKNRYPEDVTTFLNNFNAAHQMDLPVLEERFSPSATRRTDAQQCLVKMKYLFFQSPVSLDNAIHSWKQDLVNQRLWVFKPHQDPDTIIADHERATTLLLHHLVQNCEAFKASKAGFKPISDQGSSIAQPALCRTIAAENQRSGIPNYSDGSGFVNTARQRDHRLTEAAITAQSPSKAQTTPKKLIQRKLDFQSTVAPLKSGRGHQAAEKKVAPSGQPISPRQEGILDGRSAIFLKDRNDKKAAHCERNAAHEDSTAVLPETEVYHDWVPLSSPQSVARKRPYGEMSAVDTFSKPFGNNPSRLPDDGIEVLTLLATRNEQKARAVDQGDGELEARRKPTRFLVDNGTANTSFTTNVTSANTSFTTNVTSANTSFTTNVTSANTSFSTNLDSLSKVTPNTSFTSITSYPSPNGNLVLGRQSGSFKTSARGRIEKPEDILTHDATRVFIESFGDVTSLESSEPTSQPLLDKSMKDELLDARLQQRLYQRSPFTCSKIPPSLKKSELRLRYELLRVSLATGVDLSTARTSDFRTATSYPELWTKLGQCKELQNKQLPEISDLKVWEQAGKDFDRVAMTGELTLSPDTEGPLFRLRLQPLKFDGSYRLARRFGFDRFLKLTVPVLKQNTLAKHSSFEPRIVQKQVLSWLSNVEHELLGRKWAAFFIKDRDSRKKRVGRDVTLYETMKKDIFFFATEGEDFRSRPTFIPPKLEPMDAHTPLSVRYMLDWLLSFEDNKLRPYLQLFSRIGLGLSKTERTVVFRPDQIVWRKHDIRSTVHPHKVMNDGCDIITPAVAYTIARTLNLNDRVPSAFQARIAGAKGVWIVDPTKNPYRDDSDDFNQHRIWISPKQVKFQCHKADLTLDPDLDREDRVAFEVQAYSKPLRSATLNSDLLPILATGGVPRETLRAIVEDDLSNELRDQEVALTNTYALRKYIHDHFLPEQKDNTLHRYGSPAASKSDQMIMLLEGGFKPLECLHLKELAQKSFSERCNILKDRLNIPIGRSAYVFCVPDVTGTLEEGEVHLAFSGTFKDEASGFQDTGLNDMDVLVARNPALRACDIQKVHAVVNPSLSRLKDVIVFSTKGSTPLAEVLSGGDYDGDKVLVVWDPALVKPFKNAMPPENEPSVQELGIVKDDRTLADMKSVPHMIESSFRFNADTNKLGVCTKFYRRLCYTENTINSKGAVWIAALLGHLVDSGKQGNIFTDSTWEALTRRKDLVSKRPLTPAYENNGETKVTGHIIDYIKFQVIQPTVDQALARFDSKVKEGPLYDSDLTKLWKKMEKRAEGDSQLKDVLCGLKESLRQVKADWESKATPESRKYNELWGVRHSFEVYDQRRSRFTADIENVLALYTKVLPPALDHPLLRSWRTEDESDPFSEWKLLRASAFYSMYYRTKIPWYMAAGELAFLKLQATGRMRPLDKSIHACYKPDGNYIKRQIAAMSAEQPAVDLSDDDDYGSVDFFEFEN